MLLPAQVPDPTPHVLVLCRIDPVPQVKEQVPQAPQASQTAAIKEEENKNVCNK